MRRAINIEELIAYLSAEYRGADGRYAILLSHAAGRRSFEGLNLSRHESDQSQGRESSRNLAWHRDGFERNRDRRSSRPARRVREAHSVRLMIYFAAIGLAFMMVEIGQLERLIVFLGHPIYGLTVVLFVLLLASSLGSLFSHRLGTWIWLLPVVLAGFIVVSP